MSEMSVDVDMMAVISPLPRDVKGKNARVVSWQRPKAKKMEYLTRSAVLALAPILSGQRCNLHLPSTRAVRGVALNSWPTSLCPNPIHQTSSSAPADPEPPIRLSSLFGFLDRCSWVLQWTLVMPLSGEDFIMPANRNRALFVDCERWILSSNSWFFEPAF